MKLMNELKDLRSENDLNLYLNFHLVGDATYKKQKAELEAHLHTYFEQTYALEHEDPAGPASRELVYKVQKPIMLDEGTLKDYFLQLKELFKATHRFLPSFTQSLEIAE